MKYLQIDKYNHKTLNLYFIIVLLKIKLETSYRI